MSHDRVHHRNPCLSSAGPHGVGFGVFQVSTSIKRARVVFHGIEHSQYFQGHGLAFTTYTHTATGIGSSSAEALDDAIEQLYYEFEPEDVKTAVRETGLSFRNLEKSAAKDEETLREVSGDSEDSELHYFVSVDLEVSK